MNFENISVITKAFSLPSVAGSRTVKSIASISFGFEAKR